MPRSIAELLAPAEEFADTFEAMKVETALRNLLRRIWPFLDELDDE